MKKLLSTKKITKATLKSFIRRNKDNLFLRVNSKFDGMIDCVTNVKDTYSKVNPDNINLTNYKTTKEGWENRNYDLGIVGLWLVGSSRDYFRLIDTKNIFGIAISNSCGSCNLVIKKTEEEK